MSVTVVVNGLNEEEMIAECLASLKNQTIPAEILYIDGGSTDRTLDYAPSYADRILLGITGAVPQTNAGVEAARSDIIAKADADTVYDAQWIERITAPLQDPDVAVVGGSLVPYTENNYGYLICNSLNTLTESTNLAWGANMAFRRDDFLEVGGMKLPWLGSDLRLAGDLKSIGKQVWVPDAYAYTDVPVNWFLESLSYSAAVGVSSYYLMNNKFNPLVTGSLSLIGTKIATLMCQNDTKLHHSTLGLMGLVASPFLFKDKKNREHFAAAMHAIIYHHFITEDIATQGKAVTAALAWGITTATYYYLIGGLGKQN